MEVNRINSNYDNVNFGAKIVTRGYKNICPDFARKVEKISKKFEKQTKEYPNLSLVIHPDEFGNSIKMVSIDDGITKLSSRFDINPDYYSLAEWEVKGLKSNDKETLLKSLVTSFKVLVNLRESEIALQHGDRKKAETIFKKIGELSKDNISLKNFVADVKTNSILMDTNGLYF